MTDATEARAVLADLLATYRDRDPRALLARLYQPESGEIASASGVTYYVHAQVVYDDPHGASDALRVEATAHDGSLLGRLRPVTLALRLGSAVAVPVASIERFARPSRPATTTGHPHAATA